MQKTEESFEQIVPVEEGAEAFLEVLNSNRVKYVFINPGTDTFPIQEAVSKFNALGRAHPEFVLSLHETFAMSAAHGYFMVSGEPQVVLVHVDVGTQQIGGAIHNAQRGQAGVVVCAGRSPWTTEGEKRGSRDIYILWYQEPLDQAGVVAGCVKWHYELRCNENIQHVVQRAFQIAGSEPYGPVYLTLPREVLMEKIKEVHLLPRERYGPAISPQADTPLLREIAELLLKSKNPLAITGYLGRHPHAVAPFVELAETLGMRVVGTLARMNFPTAHPLWSGILPNPYLKDSDVILIVDEVVPYVPAHVKPSPEAKIIYVDIDPLKANSPMWNFPADIRLHADSSRVIPALQQMVQDIITPEEISRSKERFQKIQTDYEAHQVKWQSQAESEAQQHPISPGWLSYCISRELDEETIILEEVVTNAASLVRHLKRSIPGTFFRSGGSSLGWALGAGFGAKLARPDKTVVSIVGDGTFIFGCPIAAYWASTQYKAPFLTIIFNNQSYFASKRALQGGYGPQSYAQTSAQWVGVDIAPSPDYAQIAQAAGAWGERVEDPKAVRPSIRRALERVRNGQSAVLDVILGRP
jgi:acetolactate synthase-1/2/3 large subunit